MNDEMMHNENSSSLYSFATRDRFCSPCNTNIHSAIDVLAVVVVDVVVVQLLLCVMFN
jgi:hypothetical protein